MAPSSTPAQPSTAATHSELMNRMNMLLGKHSSTMTALKRPTAADANTSKASSAAKQKSKSTFSALKNSSASTTSIPTTVSTTKNNNNNTNDNDDDIEDFVSSEHGGIDFKPAGSKAPVEGAATRDLRGKLLGKRAREQKEDAAAARRKQQGRGGGRRVDDEDSDEDEGRSKIGKGRKKKARKAAVDEEDG